MENQIPYATMHPKARLEKLIYEFNEDLTKSKMDIYKEIAEKIKGLLEVVWVYLDHFRAPATCRSGLSGAGIPRLAVRMHVAG
jgi:hypothetical protein